MIRDGENFDTCANIAEIIDAILQAERSRDRRLALIRHHVKRAMASAFKAGLRRLAAENEKPAGGQIRRAIRNIQKDHRGAEQQSKLGGSSDR
jgi:hypothetical protein